GKEVPMCGHATVGSMWLLRKLGKISDGTVLVETKSGLLPIDVTQKDGRIQIGMTQVPYQEKGFGGSKAALAEAIGLTEADLDPRFPVVYGYTGLWTLMLPIKTIEAFSRMKRDTERFPSILTEEPGASIHPFCLGGVLEGVQIHARHFSSPFTGIGEDPVTGTASGVTGAYYKRYIADDPAKAYLVRMEQGLEIGTRAIVETFVEADPSLPPKIFGTAVEVEHLELDPD
ncbi:MAG: PhzF family phenazine biosynthesis isomerase, partial [Firmicutes bacterium]|nr:PhzF family phenazine biosynthesis isomerase [Bacillota bacterium]